MTTIIISLALLFVAAIPGFIKLLAPLFVAAIPGLNIKLFNFGYFPPQLIDISLTTATASSNLIGVLDIFKRVETLKDDSRSSKNKSLRWLFLQYLGQLVFLALILVYLFTYAISLSLSGQLTDHTLKSLAAFFTIGAYSLVAYFIFTYWISHSRAKKEKTNLIVLLILVVSALTAINFYAVFRTETIKAASPLIAALVALLFIPLTYLVGDLIAKGTRYEDFELIKIDLMMLYSSFMFLILPYGNPSLDEHSRSQFWAGSAACITVLSNIIYFNHTRYSHIINYFGLGLRPSFKEDSTKMMVDKKRLSSSLDRQARWAESLWDEIGNLWPDRKGQDHVYREQVTSKFLMVAITNHILKHNLRSWQLVDLGCGDGIPTSKLIMKLNELSSNCESEISILPDSILLIDRSQPLLSAASQNIDRVLHQSTTMSSDRQDTSKFKNLLSRRRLSCSAFAIDLVTDYLDSHIDGTKSNIFISEFVLQELPSLSNLFSSLSVTLNKDSLAIFIIPHPVFANQLLNDKRIPSAHIAAPGDACDWEWCGEYPVPNGRTMLYLPHFQRSLDLIREKGSEHKLHIEFEDMYLSHAILDCDSPNTNFASIEQLRVAYGSSIIDLPSSCALMVSHKSSEVS